MVTDTVVLVQGRAPVLDLVADPVQGQADLAEAPEHRVQLVSVVETRRVATEVETPRVPTDLEVETHRAVTVVEAAQAPLGSEVETHRAVMEEETV